MLQAAQAGGGHRFGVIVRLRVPPVRNPTPAQRTAGILRPFVQEDLPGPAGWGIGLRPDKNQWGDFLGFLLGGFIAPGDMKDAGDGLKNCRLPGDAGAALKGNQYADLGV